MKAFYTRRSFYLLMFTFLTVVVYANSMHGAFHFDDKQHLLENPNIRGWDKWYEQILNPFRALLWLTFWLNYQINGYETFGWHVVNLAMHLVNVLLVFFLVRQFFEKRADEMALGVAMLFAVHPIQTESVSYIISRSELMVANFYLSSLLCWSQYRCSVHYNKRFSDPLFLGSVGFFILSLFTKESAITLPVILLFWEWFFPVAKNSKAILQRFRPFLVFFVLFIAWFVYRHYALLGTLGNPDAIAIPAADTYHWTETRVLVRYLSLLLVPVGLNIDPDIIPSISFFEPKVMLSCLIHAFLLGLAVALRKRLPLMGFAVFWFYITVAPTSSFVALRDAMAEHRVYLPALGIFIMMTVAIFQIGDDLAPKLKPKLAWGFLLCFILLYSILTVQRNRVYRDGISLWGDTVIKSPGKSRPFYNLGNAFFNADQYELAIKSYTRSIAINPQYLAPYFNRGNTYNRLGKIELANVDYQQVIKLNPNFYQAWYNMGVLLNQLGEFDQARQAFDKVLQIYPTFLDAYNGIGVIYFHRGDYVHAKKYFEKVLRENPKSLEANLNMAHSLFNLGESLQALPYYQRSVNLDSGNPKTWLSLAICRNRLGMDVRETELILEKIVRLNPAMKQHRQYQELAQELKKQLVLR